MIFSVSPFHGLEPGEVQVFDPDFCEYCMLDSLDQVCEHAARLRISPLGSTHNLLSGPFLDSYGSAATEDSCIGGNVAAEHAECPIIFEPLHAAPVGVFVDDAGRRVSPHFYNLEAALAHLHESSHSSDKQPRCPLTRRCVSRVVRIPDVREDPVGWFSAVDFDGDGRLTKQEVVAALKVQLPLDLARLDAAVDDPRSAFSTHWADWDEDCSGTVEIGEIRRIAAMVQRCYDPSAPVSATPAVSASAGTASGTSGLLRGEPPPDIRQSKEDWYRYWDEDCSGTLQKAEVVRALVKTFALSDRSCCCSSGGTEGGGGGGEAASRGRVANIRRIARSIRETVSAVWPIFDTDASGSIDREEFLGPGDGLADTIIAQVRQAQHSP